MDSFTHMEKAKRRQSNLQGSLKISRIFGHEATRKLALVCLTATLSTACTGPKFEALKPTSQTASKSPDQPNPTPSVNKLTEAFDQDSGANQVDILIINDNSTSMFFEQSKMADRFSSFISELKDVDYHIGMTTTNSNLLLKGQFGALMKWNGTESYILKQDTLGADEVFKNTIVRPETLACTNGTQTVDCPSGDEQPLLAMMYAYGNKDGLNAGFFRDHADLAVVVLSDEDEMSNGASGTPSIEVMKFFAGVFAGTGKRFSVHGMIIEPGDAQCLKEQTDQLSRGSSSYGSRVDQLAKATGGIVGSICSDDYATPLAAISHRLRALIGKFDLKHSPKLDSIHVKLTPDANIGYHVEGKQLVFESAPPAGTKIEITYEY